MHNFVESMSVGCCVGTTVEIHVCVQGHNFNKYIIWRENFMRKQLCLSAW